MSFWEKLGFGSKAQESPEEQKQRKISELMKQIENKKSRIREIQKNAEMEPVLQDSRDIERFMAEVAELEKQLAYIQGESGAEQVEEKEEVPA